MQLYQTDPFEYVEFESVRLTQDWIVDSMAVRL